ncbi:MAG: DUF4145 domain-containing protein [Planctomycetes bacterium]|nr:DUF4145 domain-containing protein [Planctomycetota bacterium]
MDRQLWKLKIVDAKVPAWPCPKCHEGRLAVLNDDLRYRETFNSRVSHSDENWDPDWIAHRFGALLTCPSKNCAEVVSCVGVGGVELEYLENSAGGVDQMYMTTFTPRFFCPPLRMLKLPEKCPAEVVEAMEKSFALFFADPGSSLNYLRQAAENLLTSLGVRRFLKDGTKLRRLDLARRIDLFKSKNAEVASSLDAIRHLGNAGSHPGKVAPDDVLDGYEIFEDVLSRLFTRHDKTLRKKVETIVRRKAPLSRLRSRRMK